MTRQTSFRLRPTLAATAVCAAIAALSSGTARADDPFLSAKLFRDTDVLFRDADMTRWADNYVELGLGYNSRDSLRFGQFSGLTDKGGFAMLGFNWLNRDKGNDAQYWHVYGSTLGLDSRKLSAEGGTQGVWNLSFSVDQLKKSQTDSASFVHQGLGTSNLTLPAGYNKALVTSPANTTDPDLLRQAPLNRFDIDHGRDIYRLGLNGQLANNWDYRVNYREDHRDGTRMTGLFFNAGATVIVPYQIDDKTQQIEAQLAYASKLAQLQFGYTYSRFSNNLSAFRVQAPFSGANDARMSLMPDNDYHQFDAKGAYNFGKTTRLSGQFSYGIARQNEGYLPYTTGTAAIALPRGSLDGKVVKTLLDVALTTKPLDKMNLKVGFQYRDNDNRTPIAQYLYASRDGNQATLPLPATGSGNVRSNAPVSNTEYKASVEGDYEIAAKTLLRAGLERTHRKYTLTDRTFTDTDKLSLELRRPIADDFLGSLGYTYTQRRGSEYDKNVFFRNSYTDPNFQTNISAAGGRLTNHPSMRSFMYGDFNEDRIRASGNWTLSETVNLQASADTYRQRAVGTNCATIIDANAAAAITGALPDTCLGRKLAEGTTVSLDLQWQPEENLTTFAFLTSSETGIDEDGRTWTRGNTTAADTRQNWSAKLKNRDNTLGIGLKWQPVEQWDLGGTYVFNRGSGKTNVATGSNLTSSLLPDNYNRLHTVQLFAKWSYSKRMDFRLNYVYENLKSYDWAIDNIGATSVNNVLLTGQTSPHYSNHVLGVSAVIKNW